MALPVLPHNAIARPRLVERLERGMGYPLTLIAAPAGSGKTTLLAQWAAQQARPLAWLSLDAGDRAPIRALARLATALKPLQPNVEPAIVPDIEQVLVALLNGLAQVPSDVVVVLDNCHEVEGSPLDEAAGRLLDYLPPQVHLVVAGRHRPPWPLGRLRARSQLLEMSAAELCFPQEETAALIQALLAEVVAPAHAAALQACCDGWAVGLCQAAEVLQTCADPDAAIATFSGRHAALARYFEAEVLAPQPEDLQAFLLQTSVLERLQAPLCNAVTSRRDGQAMLEELERRNLFTIPLDGERRAYRYHRLFAGYLQDTLARRHPKLAALLRQRASAWVGER